MNSFSSALRMAVLFTLPALAYAVPQFQPFLVGPHGAVTSSSVRSLCGSNDMVPMINESDAIQQMGKPVGLYKIDYGGGAVGMCTGTLISKDMFLTAQHCAGDCKAITVTFGYLKNTRNEVFKCKEVVEEGDGTQPNDYFIIRLEGDPGVNWGWYGVSSENLSAGQPLMLIHHPEGQPMTVSLNDCSVYDETSTMLEHRCDTEPGSSGTGILVPDFDHLENNRIVAVHTLGGCDPQDPHSFNSGPAMSHLVTVSATLKSLDGKPSFLGSR